MNYAMVRAVGVVYCLKLGLLVLVACGVTDPEPTERPCTVYVLSQYGETVAFEQEDPYDVAWFINFMSKQVTVVDVWSEDCD